jgi:hypothetical protein
MLVKILFSKYLLIMLIDGDNSESFKFDLTFFLFFSLFLFI